MRMFVAALSETQSISAQCCASEARRPGSTSRIAPSPIGGGESTSSPASSRPAAASRQNASAISGLTVLAAGTTIAAPGPRAPSPASTAQVTLNP